MLENGSAIVPTEGKVMASTTALVESRIANEYEVTSLMEAQDEYLQCFAKGYEVAGEVLYNALQSPSKTVNDSIGEAFNLVGFVAHNVNMINEDTGVLNRAPRIILFGSNGETFVSVSKTMFSSLKKLVLFYKSVDKWPKTGIPVKLKQTSNGQKRYFSLELVIPAPTNTTNG